MLFVRAMSRAQWKADRRTHLETVTDPEDGHAEIKDGRVDSRGILVVYRVGRSGEDDTCHNSVYEPFCRRDAHDVLVSG